MTPWHPDLLHCHPMVPSRDATSPRHVPWLPRSPQSVQEPLGAGGGLVFQDFDAAFHLVGGKREAESSLGLPPSSPRCMSRMSSPLDQLRDIPTGDIRGEGPSSIAATLR